MHFVGKCLVFCIRCYQLTFAAFTGNNCRFYPNCSTYVAEAIKIHGPGKGVVLGTARILRCNPWGSSGYDPVPPDVDDTHSQLPPG